MTPAELGWDVTLQTGRPALEMTPAQARAWAARVEGLMRAQPGRTAEWWLHDLGLSRKQAGQVLAELKEGA